MSGKRERNKQQKYFDFLAAATRLFSDKGVENTTMQEIAAAVATGTKTLNRYFATKSALILAILKEDDRISLKRVEVKARSLPVDPINRLYELFAVYVDYSMIINNIAVWREYEATRISEYKNAPMDHGAVNLRAGVVGITYSVIEDMKGEGLLDKRVSSEKLTNQIHATALLNYHKTLRGLFSTEEDALVTLHSDITFIMTPYLIESGPNS